MEEPNGPSYMMLGGAKHRVYHVKGQKTGYVLKGGVLYSKAAIAAEMARLKKKREAAAAAAAKPIYRPFGQANRPTVGLPKASAPRLPSPKPAGLPKDIVMHHDTPIVVPVSRVPKRAPKLIATGAYSLRDSDAPAYFRKHMDTLNADVGDIINLENDYRMNGVYYVTKEGYIRQFPRDPMSHPTHVMPSMIRPFIGTPHFAATIKFYDDIFNEWDAKIMDKGKIIKDIVRHPGKRHVFDITYFERKKDGRIVVVTEKDYDAGNDFAGYI